MFDLFGMNETLNEKNHRVRKREGAGLWPSTVQNIFPLVLSVLDIILSLEVSPHFSKIHMIHYSLYLK